MLEDAIKRYHNGMIDTVEFLEKVLIPFAEQIKAADKRGEKLGLDYREYAFYTALEINNSAVSLLGDETLKHIAQELLKTVRNRSYSLGFFTLVCEGAQIWKRAAGQSYKRRI